MTKCIGCGIELQSVNKGLDGYAYDSNLQLCERCFNIKNYGKNKETSRTNADYISIINNIRDNDVVVYVSSILTLNLDYMSKFKKVILVLTKRDVLPKSIKDNKIINYIKSKYDNLIDIVIVSAYKKYNLDLLYNKLNKYKNNDIYFVGITNSGKSTLINEMIKSYNGVDGNITTSNYPSTTLGVVKVKIGSLKIKDTPGIVIQNSLVNYLNDKEIKKLNSKKEIKPITIQLKDKGTILIDEFLRIEYETDISSMTLYLSNNIKVSQISFKNPRLLDGMTYEYDILNNQDIVIEDMGFIKFTNEVKLKVYSKYDIYTYIRDNLI